MSCELVGDGGEVLTFHRCHFNDPHQHLDDSYVDFHETLAWQKDVKTVRFLLHGKATEEITVESDPPQVMNVNMVEKMGADQDIVTLSWEAAHPEAEREKSLQYILHYSNDGGETWRAIATHLTEKSYDVPLSLLPGSPHENKCIFQVVACSGIRTATALSPPFSKPPRPQEAHILEPESNAREGEPITFSQGEPVVLRGWGYSPDFESADFEDGVWSSSIDGTIGVGNEVVTRALSVGLHRITFKVT